MSVVPLIHPTSVLDPLYVCCWFISNTLTQSNSGSLKLTLVSSQSQKVASALHTIPRLLCWRNERYARGTRINFLPLLCSSKGHFTHEPRAVTMRLWEPKRKCPKAALRHFQKHVVWSRALERSVKPYVTEPPTKCYSNEFLLMQHPRTWSNIINQWLWVFTVAWSPCRPTFKRWVLKIIQVTMKQTYSMPCRNPCRLYIHLVFTYSRWSLKRSVKQTWTGSAFSTNESAWSGMVTGSQFRVWSDPIYSLSFKIKVAF